MFISSYATYVNTSATDRPNRQKLDTENKQSQKFSSVLTKNTPVQAYSPKNFPIDYISNYKSLNNQQKLQEQLDGAKKVKTDMRDLKGAKVAYISNTTMFSLITKPKTSLKQANTISEVYPKNIQELKEGNLKERMVNTYLQNDRYYQITA